MAHGPYNVPPQSPVNRLGYPHTNEVMNRPRLGQYKIVKTLGEGSFGKVKLAIHAVTGQKVALKIISSCKLLVRDRLQGPGVNARLHALNHVGSNDGGFCIFILNDAASAMV